MKTQLKTSEKIKVTDIQNVYLSGKKVTLFNVYSLKDNTWIFDYNAYIFGWYKKPSTVLDKILLK